MTGVVGRPRAGTPDKVGDRYVVSRNDGSQQQDLWFVADTLDELRQGGRLLLDPNTFSADGTSSLAGYNASKDGRWLAYLVSDGGSDWSSIRLLDLAGGHEVDDVVPQGEVQRGDLAARPLLLPLPLLPDRRAPASAPRRPRCPAASCGGTTSASPRTTTSWSWSSPRTRGSSSHPDAVARRPLARVTLHEGTSEKNRLWVLPGATPSTAPRSSASRSRSSTRRSPATTPVRARRRRPPAVDRPRRAAGPGGAARPRGVPRHRPRATSSTWSPRATSALRDVQAVGAELLGRAPGRRTAAADALRPRRLALGTVDVPGGAVVALHGDVDDDEVFLGLSS